MYVLSDHRSVRLYSAKKENYIEKKFEIPVRKVVISADGNTVVVLKGKPWNEGQISFFDISSMYFNKTKTDIRGLPYVDTELNTYGNGNKLLINLRSSPLVSDSETGISLFEWI